MELLGKNVEIKKKNTKINANLIKIKINFDWRRNLKKINKKAKNKIF